MNYTSVEKKNVIKETAICERKVTSMRATFNLSKIVTYVYDRSKTFSFIIVFSTVVFSSRKLVFLLNLEVSTRNDMGDILKFELT